MKSQLNTLNQLQELVLTRDEHHRIGDGSHMDSLDQSIDALVDKLEPQPKALYQRLYKKDHIVMSPMVNGCCAVCGMRLPISQIQQVRLAKTIQTCSSCGRMLYNEEDDAPRSTVEPPARGEPRKTGISRFSAEELMICDLKSSTAEGAIRELAEVMVANRFVSNADALVVAAMERESILSTAMGNGLAFPHVRGVEGGGLTIALGVSKGGIVYDDSGTKVNFIFFSVIPVAVSAFYLRLMSGLTDAFAKKANRDMLAAAKTPTELWKALTKTTRSTIQ
jgi:mannitol/fructose-specific phosphotransferase system IIA component (Ntr-type)